MAGNLVEFTSANFEDEVMKSDAPVLVDFWAPWCMPCRMLTPVIEQLADEYAGKAKVGKLNTEENPDVAAKFGIQAIPTLLVFKNGQLVDRSVGVKAKEDIAAMLDKAIGD